MELFQAKGWNVVATMRRPEAETELSRLDNTLVTRLDVEDAGSITSAVRAGRSLDFSNDPEIADYQPAVGKVLGVLGPLTAEGSAPSHIAETVFAAVTDQLRHEAGADGIRMLSVRRAADDATFLAGVRDQFGLAGVRSAAVR